MMLSPLKIIALFLIILGFTPRMSAQDALNLPTELYILLNEGVVERYGLGTSGRMRVTPEDAFVLDFQVAPDGVWLAYRTQEGLFLVEMYDNSVTPLALAGANISIPYARGRGETLAWAPDSRAIAFTTLENGGVYLLDSGTFARLDTTQLLDLIWSPDGRYLATRAEDNIWWIYRRDDQAFNLASIIIDGTSATWLDRTRLAFTPSTGGVTLMDMAQGNAQTPLLPSGNRYHLPRRIDDETLHIFAMSDEVSGRLQRITLDEAGNVDVEMLGFNDIPLNGVRWTPNEQLLTAFRGGVLALVDAIGGEGFALPMTSASAYGWGASYPPMRDTLPLSATLHYIAPTPEGIAQVWEALDATFPRTITPALTDVSEYAISADGRNLAYVSEAQLWTMPLNTPQAQPLSLIDLGIGLEISPAFSADGQRIFYRDVVGDEAGIWAIDIADGNVTLVVRDYDVAQHYNPRPSLSVSAMTITVRSAESSRNGILLVDTTSGEQAFLGNYTRADWLGGSNLLVEGFVPRADIPFTGLHIIDVNNLEEPPFTVFALEEDEFLLDVRPMPDNRLRLLLQNRPPSIVRVVDVAITGGNPAVIKTIGYLTHPHLSPDGQQIVGTTHKNGSLIWIDLANDLRHRLQSTFTARDLRWR